MQIDLHPEVAAALAAGEPVIALESTVIAHGLPRPQNLEAARRLEAIAREEGVVPATIAVIDGRVRVGLEAADLERLATTRDVMKVSRRDYAVAVARGRTGATTVAATMMAAHWAGVRVFATGGIGGVHRGSRNDISADLPELARTPVVVVCAGAKAILDLAATLEWLETHGVPVVGYQTDELPAFYARGSGLELQVRADTPAEAAALARTQADLGLAAGLLVAVPPPMEHALASETMEAAIRAALAAAAADGIRGKALTPFLLSRVAESTGGRSIAANIALLENNVRVAAGIAAALSG